MVGRETWLDLLSGEGLREARMDGQRLCRRLGKICWTRMVAMEGSGSL